MWKRHVYANIVCRFPFCVVWIRLDTVLCGCQWLFILISPHLIPVHKSDVVCSNRNEFSASSVRYRCVTTSTSAGHILNAPIGNCAQVCMCFFFFFHVVVHASVVSVSLLPPLVLQFCCNMAIVTITSCRFMLEPLSACRIHNIIFPWTRRQSYVSTAVEAAAATCKHSA